MNNGESIYGLLKKPQNLGLIHKPNRRQRRQPQQGVDMLVVNHDSENQAHQQNTHQQNTHQQNTHQQNTHQQNKRPPRATNRNQQSNRAERAASKHANRLAAKKASSADSLNDLETKMARSKARSNRPKQENKTSNPRNRMRQKQIGNKPSALRQAGQRLSSRERNDDREEPEAPPPPHQNAYEMPQQARVRGQSSGGGACAFDWNNQQQQQNSQYQQQDTFGSAPRQMSSNTFANGHHQNTGNVITDRSSVRLHAPAGGHTTINIFDHAQNDSQFTNSNSQHSSNNSSSTNQSHMPPLNIKNNHNNDYVHGTRGVSHSAQSSNAYANGLSQNTGNQITDRPSVRLHAPPGGRSNVQFC